MKTKLKILSNAFYFSICLFFINNSNKLPFLEDIANIENGSFSDVLLNFLYSILGFIFLILIGMHLVKNYQKYVKTQDCGALNPFC